jgi:hypothetical protein
MGQAKNRGSKQERFEQALDKFKPTSREDIKQQMGLSKDCNFLGYVIHLPESDEFLSRFSDDNEATFKGWSPVPDVALRYDDFHEAVKILKIVSKSNRETVLALLWEDDTQYFVTISA